MSEQRPERPQRKNGRQTPTNPGLRFSQKGLFGWVLIIALGVLLIMLISKSSNTYRQISISEFEKRLVEGNDPVKKIVINLDEVTGEFTTPQTIPGDTTPVTKFRVIYPSGTFTNGSAQLRWLMDHHGNAD